MYCVCVAICSQVTDSDTVANSMHGFILLPATYIIYSYISFMHF